MNAQELYRAGRLTEAVTRQTEEVRSHPTDVERRSFLSELLCIAGSLERGDAQLETIERMQPTLGPGLPLMRQLIRAEKTRQEVQRDGRMPDFLGEPPGHVRLRLQAMVALRSGHAAEALSLAQQAEEGRPALAGSCDGVPFDDFRDLDDAIAGCFEVLTSTGRHLWVPAENVVSIDFEVPGRPLDLLWRPAAMEVRDGPDGKVFLPTVYASEGASDDEARLGRRTDWVSAGEEGPVRGIGLRTFLIGDEARSVLEITHLNFEPGV